MIELSRHIEVLLLKHDCVIVPRLGGFVTQYVSAHCEKDESLMLPPHRTVGFNSEMTLNDGLLVQSYMQAYDASYPETLRIVDDAVSRLQNELRKEGSFEFRGIGVLRLNLDGTYHFTPNEAGILSPELYGLSSLPLKVLRKQSVKPVEKKEETVAEVSEKQKKNYTLSINRELCNYVAAAVVAVVFYFLWATPLGTLSPDGNAELTAAATPFVKPVRKEEVKKVPVEQPVAVEEVKVEAPTDTVAAPKPVLPQPVEAEEPVGGYTIVLSSAIPEKNAAEYVETLGAKAISAKVYKKGRMVRVISGQYADEAAAQSELNRQREKHADFQDAWVMELK